MAGAVTRGTAVQLERAAGCARARRAARAAAGRSGHGVARARRAGGRAPRRTRPQRPAPASTGSSTGGAWAIVQIAFKPFSFYGEDGARTGFDIDFLREFARRWLDDPGALTYLPVPADERIPMLQKGRADLIAAALTKFARAGREVDFSLTYFKDAQRLLVPAASEVADVCDLKDKKVAAVEGSTASTTSRLRPRDAGSSWVIG